LPPAFEAGLDLPSNFNPYYFYANSGTL
jgi:hypothetical protein